MIRGHKHETVEVCLKRAHIDKNIAPFVRWLNTFEQVTTLFSCEGTVLANGKTIRDAYVTLLSGMVHFHWLHKILPKIRELVDLETKGEFRIREPVYIRLTFKNVACRDTLNALWKEHEHETT